MKAGVNLIGFCLFLAGFGEITVSGDVCSSLTPQDTVHCGSRNISKPLCETRGCCWDETLSKANARCFRSKRLNGTCMQYPEHGTCFSYLNNSVPQYRDAPRFIDYNIGLNKTDSHLKIFHDLVNIVAKDEFSQTCVHKIRIMLCQYILTPCEGGIPVQICRRDCHRFEKECPQTLQKLIGGARFALSKSKTDFVHIRLPDCKNLEYEEDLAKDGRKCYTTGLFNETRVSNNGSAPTKNNEDKTPLITAVVVVAALIIICMVVFVLYRRRRKRDEHCKLEPGTPSISQRGLGEFPSISMKDHINNLSADDLLKSKIAITDPKYINQYPVDMVAYEKDLGEGQFGQVFQGRAVGLNKEKPEAETIVAVKTLKKGCSSEARDEFDQEACLMNFLSHPNIVKLLAVSAMEEPYCMIFEFMSKGDLSEYLRKSEPLLENTTEQTDSDKNYLSQETLIKMSLDVANGLQYLSSHRLIHRDVATRNCLVADDMTIKIADFGMSRDIYANNYYKIERETVLPIRWLSPEAVLFGKFTIESDVYSYGVLLWEIFTFSMQPYYGYTNKEVLEFIAKAVHLAKPDFCPDLVYTIMKDCWVKTPELRPHYHSIIDRLNEKEANYDHPRSWQDNEQPDSPLYQNMPLTPNEVDEDPESVDGNEAPLISSPSLGEPIDGYNGDGLFMANNPLYKKKDTRDSDEASYSQGSTNSAVESETGETLAAVVVDPDSKTYNLNGQQNTDKTTNQTYV